MKQEQRNRWADALESGKYEQGFKYARSLDNKYCPLGVLVDILGYKWTQGPCAFKTERRIPLAELDVSIYMHNLIIVLNDIDKRSFKEIAVTIRNFP